jgi:DNA-binding CsgD family transcriptional regulator
MTRRALKWRQQSETRLTPRQTQVLDRVTRGLENKQIARELGVSEQAVKEQVSSLLQRFNVPNRAALAEAGTARRITGTHAIEPAWLQYLFSEAPVMIAMLRGPAHTIEIANEAFRRSCADRDFLGRPFREVFPETSSEMLAIYDEVFASGVPQIKHEIPARFLHDGRAELGWGSFAFQPLRGDDGEVDGVMVFSLDVTDAVRAREQLQELTAEHLAVLDQIPSSVLVFNAEGRLIKINESGRKLIGVTMLGTTPEDRRLTGALRDPDTDAPLEIEDFPSTRALRGEHVDRLVRYRRAESGTELLLRARATPLLRSDGSVRGAVLIFARDLMSGADALSAERARPH